MKKELLTILSLLVFATAFGQVTDTTITDKNIKNKILDDIQVSLESKTKALDSTVTKLDKKVDDLDKAIATSKNASDKADKLLERVQALEKRQTTVEENEMNVYQANYQSAVINLVSMDREIKPLILFNSTRDFFTSLSATSNPMTYPGYQVWYGKFSEYIDKQKGKEAGLNVLSSLITLTGDLSKGTPFSGPITEPLFNGIASFINTLGNSKKELRIESEKMFLLTAKISQFTHDKDLIESEWGSITNELEELQKHYDDILKQNLKLLSIDENDFKAKFSKENDANKRYEYLTLLKLKSAELVLNQKTNNSKEWKEIIYFQLMDVQALKLSFGRITFKISENIARYKILIAKYKADPQIGGEVSKLETKLTDLKETFDRAFEPIDYINSATRMYKVN